jgi:hypothetical protein
MFERTCGNSIKKRVSPKRPMTEKRDKNVKKKLNKYYVRDVRLLSHNTHP